MSARPSDRFVYCAGGETRTLKPVKVADFESAAYTISPPRLGADRLITPFAAGSLGVLRRRLGGGAGPANGASKSASSVPVVYPRDMAKRVGGRWLPVGGLLILSLGGVGSTNGPRGSWGGAAALAQTKDEDPRPIPEAHPTQEAAPSLLDPEHKPRSLAYDDERPFYKSPVFWVMTGVLV